MRTKAKPSVAAAKAGLSTASGYRIEADPRLPSEKRTVRGRRRPDPLAGIFEEEVVPLLQRAPQLRAATIFEELLRRPPRTGAAGAPHAGTPRAPLVLFLGASKLLTLPRGKPQANGRGALVLLAIGPAVQ